MDRKIIDFGFNNFNELKNRLDGIIRYKGELLGLININNSNYLITQSILPFEHGRIDIREVIQDIYSDGSYALYGNIEKSKTCLVFEKYFNRDDIKEVISKNVPIMYILLDLQNLLKINMNLRESNFISVNDKYKPTTVILINNNVFIESKEIIDNNRNKSLYELGKEIKTLKLEYRYKKN